MGWNIFVGNIDRGKGLEYAVFYDTVTEVCFGPLMNDLEEAENFQKWLGEDPRAVGVDNLILKLNKFRKLRENGKL